jgi:ubiquinone/menaquinone biosynthesis C-methylase UbiE
MNYAGTELAQIAAEYERRAREIPADYYSWASAGNLLMYTQTMRAVIGMLSREGLFPLTGLRIADFGCGDGTWLLEYMQWGAQASDLAGIDLMPERIARARERVPQADLRQGSASELPWPDHSFDIVSQFLVFMNMADPALKGAVAGEMLRVLRPGGAILWFDLRVDNPRNPRAHGVRAAEIRKLFRGYRVRLAPALLAPPLARRVAGWSWPLADALQSVPWLCTHYAGLVRKC